jgi:WD40 repeat protein
MKSSARIVFALMFVTVFAFVSSPFNRGPMTGTGVAYAAEPPQVPILRISTEMHTATVRAVATDAGNQYLVTGSEDKTAKVWELRTGRLLATLRPPIGAGSEGYIMAVAITPDGKTIACGTTTLGGENAYSIYLFDRASGKMVKRCAGLAGSPVCLAYSRDGRYLAVTQSGKNGVRVYATADYSLVKEDKDYGAYTRDADFDRDGRLVTASYDGYVRLYDRNLNLVKKQQVHNGKAAASVRFSPDGSKIAVGFQGSSTIKIVSGSDLSSLYSPYTGKEESSSVSWAAVAWSYDGRFLYAGGDLKLSNGMMQIVKWPAEGKGNSIMMNAADNTIFRLLPLKDGSIAYVGGSAFGVFGPNDVKTYQKLPSTADYRFNQEGFLTSNDGMKVHFAFDGKKSPALFSISDSLLQPGPPKGNELLPPKTGAVGLSITDWNERPVPKLNGKPLTSSQGETSRSLAIAPDEKSFLLGTEHNLRLFDREGKEKWTVRLPGTGWDVNISGNGKVAIAAIDDGTVRWYRMSDGKELLAFFPLNDKKTWVLSTPKGYYSASPGGEEIIGWHINNGKEREADFFPVSRFREKYYRPDVIEKVLVTLDEDEAVRVANQESGRKSQDVTIQKMLPPVVRISSPADGTTLSDTSIPVRFSVDSPSGEAVTGIKILVNGRPVAQSRDIVLEQSPNDTKGTNRSTAPLARGSDVREVQVAIPAEDSEVTIIALNRFSAGEPATIRVKWAGKKQKDEFVIMPKLYILAVGVAKYTNLPPDKQLVYPAKDARDFAETMKKQKGKLYRDVVATVLTDGTATRDNIADGLEWIQKETTSKDVAMIFLSGHGMNDSTGVYYFVPTNFDMQKVLRTGVPYSDVKKTVSNLAGKTLVFVDTCHSGNVMGGRTKAISDPTGFVNELASAENGAVVFASATGKQVSWERPEWNNGAFTKALIEGLNGKADFTGKGKISINMIDLYLSERVKELTQGVQTPTTTKPQTIQDFPVAIR